MRAAHSYPRATEPDLPALADAIRAHLTAAGHPAFYLAWTGSSVVLEATSLDGVTDQTVQAAVDAAPAPCELLTVKRYVDQMPLAERANFLTILDQINFIRSKLPTPLGAITPEQYVAAVKAKAESLSS